MKGLHQGGWICLFFLLALGFPSWSETRPAGAPPAPRSRVGLLNLSHVIKNYDGYKRFQEELKETMKGFTERDARYRKEVEALAAEVKLPTITAERKAELEKKMRAIQRQAEDNKSDASEVVRKKQDEQLKALYRDVQEAATRYARSQGLEMVLHYNDATGDDLHSSANIARKMQAGACMPLYLAPGVDVTPEVLALLNEAARKKGK